MGVITGHLPKENTCTENNEALNPANIRQKLHLPHIQHNHPPVENANDVYEKGLKPLDKLAVQITNQVGSMGFFLAILVWTILWTGYNILASEVTALHWKSFDPFPAFVAYLLISNVIQILLMPLIMVGQNVQARHSEVRADLDFEVNQKAEKEVTAVLGHLEHNTNLLIQLMQHLDCRVSDEEMSDKEMSDKEMHAVPPEKELAEHSRQPA